MLAANEPRVIWQMGDGVTHGGRSPVRTRRLRPIWLPMPNYTPQQPHGGKERWGRPESGRALMLAVTEPQVIQQMRDWGHRWRTQPYQVWEIETDLVANAELHATTTTEGQGEVREVKER